MSESGIRTSALAEPPAGVLAVAVTLVDEGWPPLLLMTRYAATPVRPMNTAMRIGVSLPFDPDGSVN
jgi:hypothetical protein